MINALKELKDTVKSAKSEISSLKGELGNLKAELNKIKRQGNPGGPKGGPKPRDDSNLTCYKCGQKGHRADDCPNDAEAKAEAEE